MSEENVSQEFRLKNIDETRNYLIEKINQNELMSRKHKKVYRVLNYVKHLLILTSTITGCLFISSFASSVGIPTGINNSAIGLKICVIAAGIKKYRSITEKKKKKHDKILSLAKSKLNSVEVLISKALIDSNIGQDQFGSINNVPKEFDDIKKKSRILVINKSFKLYKTVLSYCLKCRKIQKVKTQKL